MSFSEHDLILLGLTAFAAFVGARLAPRGQSDTAKIARLEQKIEALLAQLGTGPTDRTAFPNFAGPSPVLNAAPENIVALVRQGHKIEAINEYRQQNPGVGLKEAKDAVERIEQTLR